MFFMLRTIGDGPPRVCRIARRPHPRRFPHAKSPGGGQAAARRRSPPRGLHITSISYGGEFPVRKLVEHGVDVIDAPVLVIEVIGMLPDIDGQERPRAVRERRFGIGGLQHLELGAFEDEPRPAAAELCDGRGREFLLAGIDAAECLLHLLLQSSGGLAAALGSQAAPVERVVPSLRRIVENARVLGLARRRGHDLLERQVCKLGARDELVRGLDVGLVMLAVMKAQRLGGNHRLERVLGIGQWRKREGRCGGCGSGHGCSCSMMVRGCMMRSKRFEHS